MDNDTFSGIIILGIIIIVIIAWPFWTFFGGAIHYSDGVRVGELIKFSQRGFFIKNWCGELSIGGQGQAGYIFDFGIDRNQNNQQLIDELNNFQGQKVEVTYDQRGANNPFNGCSDYIVSSIKVVK